MIRIPRVRSWHYVLLPAVSVAIALGSVCSGQVRESDRGRLTEPVYRVTSRSSNATSKAAAEAPPDAGADQHPLDPALQLAREALVRIQDEVKDYTCTLVKREQINGKVLDQEFMYTKIRNRQMNGDQIVVPFSVYMRFLKPDSIKGREVIYVESQNGGNMVAHEGGVRGKFLPTVNLKPTGALAMRNQRYPITEVGIETLTRRLIERGTRDRQHQECQVQFIKNGTRINDRSCTCLQVMHPVHRPHFDFYVARIFIDDELQIPIRYAAYEWPETAGGPPKVIEEYTYVNLKLNVGLADADFDQNNPNYNF